MGQTHPFVPSVIETFFYQAFTVMLLSRAFHYMHKRSMFFIKKN